MENINDALNKYEDESLNKVVKNNIDDVDELNKQFNDFMDQSFKKRRNADDVSISLTGFTNQQRYEIQMKNLIKDEAGKFFKQQNLSKALNKAHLPSITGIPASGPISPRPRIAVPSVITATRLERRVSSKDLE